MNKLFFETAAQMCIEQDFQDEKRDFFAVVFHNS